MAELEFLVITSPDGAEIARAGGLTEITAGQRWAENIAAGQNSVEEGG